MGRNKIYNPEKLKVGERMEVKGKVKKYIHQYLRAFNTRSDFVFGQQKEGKSVFIHRIS